MIDEIKNLIDVIKNQNDYEKSLDYFIKEQTKEIEKIYYRCIKKIEKIQKEKTEENDDKNYEKLLISCLHLQLSLTSLYDEKGEMKNANLQFKENRCGKN